jgi:hypothetical protein
MSSDTGVNENNDSAWNMFTEKFVPAALMFVVGVLLIYGITKIVIVCRKQRKIRLEQERQIQQQIGRELESQVISPAKSTTPSSPPPGLSK